ncbi:MULTISPECIES: acyl-CoA dehydrogenase family protein [unclassified Rhodococcus (in: high G+C Gram-positive bacteria)]|jgi:alkylation response protein AidB-like acyl-CoA dehydrogenase|uniref:acyl-CoA dehydrogenase family protein n=1 Tax=unclassified Rhodococcus (in: high G+C Gram-positive bacteria) TaxID=192944 RepID=UPI000484ED2F|nr:MULTISPECIES: acyl-CoA dehydrogenase family protein [unclassified Rhodococcus (in: high G+C Gram-positive bacteria)]KQU36453.1 acyl-CoA dehydrogenase [Rhodococcus sp. Leaf225]KQU49000.1 acyl-CoA dehydrogenase [Rhodococcus sp. Leaf258]MBY6676688.1 acyl-CoA dehydrogenase family protein [Rhodococcus sp. BP-332]MBY6682738.1 acyl-CoA dehydrogenase family protein [Rhodococcus sp. BP-316]MBY6685180.1 acyl-CoA dehydrogenase family protein [Rhodococcus sp. BP-288]
MNLALTDEEAAFRDEMRTFFRTEIPADIRERNAAGEELEREDMITTLQILNKHGMASPHWPVEWGGKDWTPMQHHIWLDELQLASVPEPLAFNISMVGPVIATFGSEEQKQKFLPPTQNLDIWWCQGFSEPEAGSDLASLRTVALRDGDEYVINGQKTWTTLGQYADWIFVLARTNPDAPKKQAGISFILVDLKTPGITVRPIKLIDGGHEVNEVWFEDVRVPVENLVGEENAGWTYAKFLLSNERTGITRLGFTKTKLAQAKALAAETTVGTGTLLDDPVFAARFAELENQVLALELTQLRIVSSYVSGKENPASSVLKLRGSELQQLATEILTDVAGPDSLPFAAGEDSPTPVWAQRATPTYLNFRKTSIYGGSNEVQRTIIASGILGL